MRGFSLIELIISITVILVLAAAAVPVYTSYQTKAELDMATTSFVERLRRAQALAQANKNDEVWGVKVKQGAIIVFQGTSFATRNRTTNETTTIALSVTPSGTTEYVFTKVTGIPQASGSTVLTTLGGNSKTITLNAQGMVSYN